MKKLLSIILMLLITLTSSLALARNVLTRDDYNLYYEIVDYLCSDWDSPYDDLIGELAYHYGTYADDIYDFIEYATENDRDHVWIPVYGGQKFHSNPDCSNMIEPRPCTWDLALDFGFRACGRCNP